MYQVYIIKTFALFVIISLYIITGSNLFGQKNSSYSKDTTYINILNKQSLDSISKNPELAAELAVEAIELSQKINYLKGLGDGYTRLGTIEKNAANFRKALDFQKLALKYRKQDGKPEPIGKSFNNIGIIFHKLDAYDSAIYYHLEAVKLGQELNDTINLIDYLHNLAIDYNRNEDYFQSLSYHKQNLNLAMASHDERKTYRSYQGISSTLIDSAEADPASGFLYDEALQYLSVFLKTDNSKIGRDLYADAYSNAGLAYQYRNHNDLDSALFYFKKSELIYIQNSLAGACVPISNIGVLYAQRKEYKSAIEYLTNSNILALEESNKLILRVNYETLAQIYGELGDFEKAYNSQSMFIIYNDSIFAEKKTKAIAELQTKYETEKKEKIIALQETEKAAQKRQIEKREQIIGIILGSSLLTLIIIGLLVNRRQLRKKLEYEKSMTHERTRISSDLHDEIGSTLSSIGMYSDFAKQQMLGNKQEEAISLLDDISNNSREMMDDMSDIIWTINPRNDSFENLITRIENHAHKICLSKNIQLHIDTSGEFNEIDMKMEMRKNIYLILKESIHNAAKYSGCTNLFLTIRRNGLHINMEVRDDGKGFDTKMEYEGNGLKNLASRALAIGSKLKIDSIPGHGTTITLQVNFT